MVTLLLTSHSLRAPKHMTMLPPPSHHLSRRTRAPNFTHLTPSTADGKQPPPSTQPLPLNPSAPPFRDSLFTATRLLRISCGESRFSTGTVQDPPEPPVPPDPPPFPASPLIRFHPTALPDISIITVDRHLLFSLSAAFALTDHHVQPPAIQNRYGNRTLSLVSCALTLSSHFPEHLSNVTRLLSAVTASISALTASILAVDRLSTPAKGEAENPRSHSQLLHGPGQLELQMSLGQGIFSMGFIPNIHSKPKFKQQVQTSSILVGSSIAPIPDLLGSGLRWNKKSWIILYTVNVKSYAEKAIAQIPAPPLQVLEQCEDSMKSFPDVKFLSNRIYLFSCIIA